MLAAADDRTVWDGVYTVEQSTLGKSAYSLSCASCHGSDLSGGEDRGDPAPPLRAADFGLRRLDLNNLYAYIKMAMPRDEPASLDGRTYLAVVAYLLQQNGYPPGREALPTDPDALKRIRIVKRP